MEAGLMWVLFILCLPFIILGVLKFDNSFNE